MDTRDYAQTIGESVVKVERGMADQRDIENLRRALLRFPPSSSTYRRIAKAIGGGSFQQPDRMESFNTVSTPQGMPLPDYFSGLASSQEPSDTGRWNRRMPPWENLSSDVTPLTPSPAEAADDTGEFPIGSNAPLTEFAMPSARDWKGNMGGAALVANPMLGHGPLYRPSEDSLESFEDYFQMMPEGYSFSEMTPGSAGMFWDDPALYARLFAESQGGGPNMASMFADPLMSARALAAVGALGTGEGRGPTGDSLQAFIPDSLKMAGVEDFLRSYNEPGNFVDPGLIYQEMFRRAEGTNWGGVMGESGLPATPEDIINMTNAALMAAAPFTGTEGEAWMDSILRNAAQEYMLALASGEIDSTVSYPAYLRSIGLDTLLE